MSKKKRLVFRKELFLKDPKVTAVMDKYELTWPDAAEGLEVQFDPQLHGSDIGMSVTVSGDSYLISRRWCEEVEAVDLSEPQRRQLQACAQLDLYWLCKSEMGSARAAHNRPVKDTRRGCWSTIGQYLSVDQSWPIYELAQWEDEEPVNILQLLGIDPQNILSST